MESIRRPGGLAKFQSSTKEECGLIISRENMLYILRVPNRSENPNDYEIYMHDVVSVEKCLSDDETIVGFFHTHLPHHKCEPSDSDLDGAELFPEMQNLIYKPSTKELCWYGSLSDKAGQETRT